MVMSGIRRGRRRRGAVLIDAIVGGVILGAGLSVLLSLMSRSTSAQVTGEKRLTAAWLADEVLSLVLIDGPDRYSRENDMTGRFPPPFDEYIYEVQIEYLGRSNPSRVNAWVRWSGRPTDVVRVETLVSPRRGDPDQPRRPEERLDREERYTRGQTM